MSSIKKLLSINNLSKTFYSLKDEIKVLNNISFDVYQNDFIGIIGPSGCGKSSILNIISNLDKDYKGTINKKENIKIGYMFQEDNLFSWLTIYENAILPLTISKTKTKENLNYVDRCHPIYWYCDAKNLELAFNPARKSFFIEFEKELPDQWKKIVKQLTL